MVKGISVKFKSYHESVPAILKVIKLDKELKKHSRIIIKPSLRHAYAKNTEVALVEEILKYCLAHKSPDAQIFIAEGSDGDETDEVFDIFGYKKLAEKYGIGLIDLNSAELHEVIDGEFQKFEKIIYPKILLDSFIISAVPLAEDEEADIYGSLANMLGAFPASAYQGFFSRGKNKIRKWPIKYSIHDILKCKMPNLAVIDARDKGMLLAGQPLEIDKQAARLLGKDPRQISHLRIVEEAVAIAEERRRQKEQALKEREARKSLQSQIR